ncbi:ABC transporter permease [Streptococcus pluranimalium]|uniref:ABC transporter permease n=1 Tax=Streptococcus pluranimalium TaxID=82348 RepID=UPI0024151CA1|nr:ABC transporter permease [Streptococcus pluranimalium]WFM79848.1 ABC transporter permease [Streptococcus pluranimalium]
MKQLLLVAKETYLRQVKSWAFLLMILSPFIFLAFSMGIGYLTGSAAASSAKVAVVLEDNSMKKAFTEIDGTTFKYKTEKTAKKALKAEDISGYLLVESADKQLEATYYSDASLAEQTKREFLQVLGSLQSQLNMVEAQLSPQQVETLVQEPSFKEDIKEKGDLQKAGKYITFFGLTFIMYFIILTYAGSTAQEIASEKGTKIMEVIFSSVPANLYFYGRILGIFGVITTHLGIYALGGFLAYKLMPQFAFSKDMVDSIKPMVDTVIDNLDWTMLFFAIFGILLYVVLAALCGSLVVRVEDVNKAVQPVMYLVIVGFVGAITLGQQGQDNLILEIGSYVPFISSFFMPIRLINGYATATETLISLSILAVTTIICILYIGKSYSGLILQTDDVGLFKSLKRGLNHK